MSAARIFNFMENSIGSSKVFMDTSGICLGRSWALIIGSELDAAKTTVAVIGPEWTRLFGRSPISMEADFGGDIDYVAYELIQSRNEGKLIIPVLVDDAEVPSKQLLPPELDFLPSLQFAKVTHKNFDDDMKRLISEIDM